MKSYILPLVASLGAVGSLTLMFATQAAPSDHAATGAAQQVRQMEYESRVREWSQGLGFDLTEANVVFAKVARDDDNGYHRDNDD